MWWVASRVILFEMHLRNLLSQDLAQEMRAVSIPFLYGPNAMALTLQPWFLVPELSFKLLTFSLPSRYVRCLESFAIHFFFRIAATGREF